MRCPVRFSASHPFQVPLAESRLHRPCPMSKMGRGPWKGIEVAKDNDWLVGHLFGSLLNL